MHVNRFRDEDDSTKLWQIQETPEGPVIVAMYDLDEGDSELKSESDWKAIPDKKAGVNVFHKGEAIIRLAVSDFGIPDSEISTLCRWLPKKLAEDSEFRNMIHKMAQAPEEIDVFEKPVEKTESLPDVGNLAVEIIEKLTHMAGEDKSKVAKLVSDLKDELDHIVAGEFSNEQESFISQPEALENL